MHQTASRPQSEAPDGPVTASPPTTPATTALSTAATSSPAGPSWAVQPLVMTAHAPAAPSNGTPLWLAMLTAALATSAVLLTALYVIERVSHG